MTGRAHWSGRLAFILAATGSAIGLGNIWKFPYIAGVNGGGAFVLIYLICIACVGIPIFIAELFIGQKSQESTVLAFTTMHKKNTPWRLPGWMGLASAFLILSFYSVVGGWILDFEFRSITSQFMNESDEQIKATLRGLFGDPVRQSFWHTVFMGLTISIVASGVSKGLERWNKILMPGLICIIFGLFIYSLFLPGFGQAMSFLFSPDASKLSAGGILEAAGHSFFTLSLGMGAMITYGSYLNKNENLIKTAFAVAFFDTLIALVAGVIIFSVVFTNNVEPGAGPALMFVTLPLLFTKMTGGYIISVAFFLLVSFAALTSAVSLLEVVVAYFVDSRKWERKKAALVAGGIIFAMGFLTVFSTNIMSEVKILGLTFFDLFDKLTTNYLLPIGGLLISVFFGWVLGPKAVNEVLGEDSPSFLKLGLTWSARLISPLVVLAFLVYALVK